MSLFSADSIRLIEMHAFKYLLQKTDQQSLNFTLIEDKKAAFQARAHYRRASILPVTTCVARCSAIF